MAHLKINHNKVTLTIAEQLIAACPFNAISYDNQILDINAGCKMCQLCMKKGPQGIIELVEETVELIDKNAWSGICVYADHEDGVIHPVTYELIGKALELAKKTNQEVFVILIGNDVQKHSQNLLQYGVNKLFIYDYSELKHFSIIPYVNVFEDFINNIKPSSILIGATNVGRSLAPRIAARFKTGLTADCTRLEIKDNTDLVQIRPAFGGNIMAQIITANTRPQLCTVRYKIFNAPAKSDPVGEVILMNIDATKLITSTTILEIVKKATTEDISDAEIIIALGRGVKNQKHLPLVAELAELLNAKIACTRPLVESNWFDAKQQIGLSGRTVKPKLIINIGISGAVQFNEGMKNSDCIISINSDRNAPIFNISHYALVGDWYEIVQTLIDTVKGGNSNV